MRFYLSLCLVLLIQLESEAQQEKKYQQDKIDSLKRGLESASGKERSGFLNELNLVYRDSLYDVAFGYGSEYYKLALALGDSASIVKGGRMIAYSLMDFGRNEEAVNLFVKILGIAKRNAEKFPELKKQIKIILNNAGTAYMYLGSYDKALDFHYQSLELREQEGDKRAIRTSYNNIGLVYFNINDYEKAIQYYLKAIELSKEINVMTGADRIYINLGLSYIQLGKFDEAIKSFENGFEICRGNCNDNIIKEGLEGLGITYFTNKQLGLAKDNFVKSLAISRRHNDKRYICENLIFLSSIEIELKNEVKGIEYLKEAELLAEPNKLAEAKLSIYKEFANYYERYKDFERSLKYRNKYIQFKDSIYGVKLISNFAKIRTAYEEQENVKAIAERDQILLLNNKLIQKQKLQTILIASVAVLLLLLTVVLYKFYRDKLLINIKLDQKVKERTEELRQNNSSLIHANELQQSLLQRIEREGQAIASGIKGLCYIAQLGIIEGVVKEYFKKVDENADKLKLLFQKTVHDFDWNPVAPERANVPNSD